jgi:hypothetical protein
MFIPLQCKQLQSLILRERQISHLHRTNTFKFLTMRGWKKGERGYWISPYDQSQCHPAKAMAKERIIARRKVEKVLEKMGLQIKKLPMTDEEIQLLVV